MKNKDIKKYAYDYKKIKCVLSNHNIKIDGLYFDLLLASYLLEPSIKPDINTVMSYYHIDINYCFKEKFGLFEEGNKELTTLTAFYSLNLYDNIKNELVKLNQLNLLNDIEIPLTDVLADIEIEGFPVSKEKLLVLKKIMKTKSIH